MSKIIIANWKANPATLEEAQALFGAEASGAEQYAGIQTVICPPFVFLEELAKINSRHLGAQDVFWEKSGPYTGEISIDMLKNFGVGHVLVGHSDRRYVLGETDEFINKKIKAVLGAGMVPVLLVGEKEKDRSRESVLTEQLDKDLAGLSAEQVAKVLFAYEPVWAISTSSGGQADTPESALEAIEFIQIILSKNFDLPPRPCLYGGSVNEQNAADFIQHPEINGAVIGGASLDARRFSKILEITSSFQK